MDLEEALAQADVYAEETEVCTIDNDLRTITIPSGLQTVGVESDEDVRRLNFQMPKQYGEVDLSEFNIKINFVNANNSGDVYAVTDKAVSGDNITFSWLVGRNALAYRGNIRFIVCLKKTDAEGVVQQEFNTTVATLSVLEGLETTEAVVAENPDIIEQILARLDELEENGGGGGTVDPEQIKQAVNGYLEENPPSGMTAEQEQQLNKNTEDISSLSEDIENIKNEGVPIKDKTITPEKTTFILTEQQENIVTEVTRYNNHPAAVVENGISSGTTIYYNIAGINSLYIFDSGTGGWVSANFSEYGTNSPYESNESGAKGKFTVTKDIPKCLFYGGAVWTWENPVINTTGVFLMALK